MKTAGFEWDEGNQIIKYNPLLHWTTQQVKEYIDKNDVPYNVLHDRGFVSIGCAPCTTLPADPENMRSGRWAGKKLECGIHISSE